MNDKKDRQADWIKYDFTECPVDADNDKGVKRLGEFLSILNIKCL